jgi:pimeloyl-ACP methyl ester carboxylesterase
MPEFSSFDDVRLHYTSRGNGTDRPVAVLLHGFAADAEANWIRPGVIDALVADGFRVLTLDARGHGRSQKPHDPAAYSNEAMVRDVQALLDHLGIARAFVVGYSMGSMIASRLAARDTRVDRLVLGGVGKRARYAMPESMNLAIAAALETPDSDDVAEPASRAFRDFADATGADKAALAAIQRGTPFDDPDLGAITAPTLVLVGERDVLAREPEKLAAAIPNATVTIVPGDHLSAFAKPEFVAALRAFLTDR